MVSDAAGGSDRCACGVSREGRRGHAYNEEAFQYFLAIERKRCGRSSRPFLLVLVDLPQQPGARGRLDPAVASRILSGLRLCLRETDFIGWYREERVVGAVLTELGDAPATDISRLVGQRVSRVLSGRLPSDLARRLQVRVNQYPESVSTVFSATLPSPSHATPLGGANISGDL